MPTFSSMESLPAFAFDNVGEVVDITLDEDAREVTTKYGPRIVISGPSGPESTALVRTGDETRPPAIGERCTAFLRLDSYQGGTIAGALRAAGLIAHTDSLTPGLRLRLKFTERRQSDMGNPSKHYSAKVDAPAPVASGGDWS